MKHITEKTLQRPVTAMMIFVSFVVIGLIASRMLPLEFFPDISYPGLYIEMPYAGSTPKEVEQLITRPTEEVLATMSGIKEMNSDSRENSAGIFVRFEMGTDIDIKSIEVKEKIDGIRNELPDDFERFFVYKFSAQDSPILTLRISSDRNLAGSYELLDRNLQQRLERIDGVSKVELGGVEPKQVLVNLNSDRIAAHNINLNTLIQRIRQSNISLTAGKIDDSGKRFMVRPVSKIKDPDEVANLIIDDSGLRLKDVADVEYKMPDLDYGRHLDMKYAVAVEVYKESGANTVEVAKRVMEQTGDINELPEMQGISIYEMDNQASGILSSLKELLKSGILGALFSVIVLFYFLRNFGTTMIVAMAVPFSLIVTLAFLYFLDLSLNILSMMGLMLAIGMLVDNAVVVTENIHRHQRMGGDPKTAIISGVREVSMAVTAGTLTSIIVFLPNVVSTDSMLAIQLYHVAVAICIALGASLLISQTIIPLLASRIKPPQPRSKPTLVDKGLNGYGKLLGWLLNHRYTSAGFILLVLFSVMIPANFVKTDMFDSSESRRLYLHYNLNSNYTLEKVEQTVTHIEEYLYGNQEKFEIESVYSWYRSDNASSTIILTEDEQAQKPVQEIKKAIEDSLPKISIGSPSFEYQSQGQDDQVRVHLIGESTERLAELSDEVIRRLETIPGLDDVRSDFESGNEEVQVVVDRERAQRMGISSMEVAQMISGGMRGQTIQRIRHNNTETDVVVRFKDRDRQSIADLMNMPIYRQGDETIKLASLARYETGNSPQQIHREDRQTSLGITANLDGLTMNEAKEAIARVLDQINYPSGYGWSYGRSFQHEEETMNQMLIDILLALALIYLVMSSLFESVLYPTSIITSILFAFIGVYWFFLMTGTPISLMAMIGILILMGIVVNNGIVLIDHINNLRKQGYGRSEAIVQGGMDRMRPILMTAGTTVLGLLPLCFGNTQVGGEGGPPYFPMARAIVGGLTFSTVVSMIILPSIYVMLDDIRNWASRVWAMARAK